MDSHSSDNVIAISERGAGLFRRRGLPESRLLISNQLGIDETLFTPVSPAERDRLRQSDGFHPRELLVGFCGRFVEQKGVLDLLAAMDLVRKATPNLPVRLVFLGTGALGDELAAAAIDRPWLRLIPPRSHEAIAPFMQMLDLFVLPSKLWIQDGEVWEEQLGHVLLEAMACGTACLGSDSGEIPAVIGEPAAVFRAGDTADLAGKIQMLLKQPSERSMLAGRQRDRILKKYTNCALASKYNEAIKSWLYAKRHSI